MSLRRDMFWALVLFTIVLTVLFALLLRKGDRMLKNSLQETQGYTSSSEINYLPIFAIGGMVTFAFALMAWRNSAGLRREQQHREQMQALRAARPVARPGQEDPAVIEAKRLWNEKRPKEAIQVLIRRINELNQR